MKKLLLTVSILLSPGMFAVAQEGQPSLQSIYQQFAFTLYDKVMEESVDNNIFSPLSAQIALSMAQNGAAGNTLAQMQEALGTTGYTTEQVNDYNKNLTAEITYRPPFDYDAASKEDRDAYDTSNPKCELSNGLWSQYGFPLYDSFRLLLEDQYQAATGEVDFGSLEGINEINQWVDEKTHHLIPSILDSPNPFITMLLANALYFKGSWTYAFDEMGTTKNDFRLTDGSSIEVDMMNQREVFSTATTEEFRTVTLPYGTGSFSMTIFLPFTDELPALTCDAWLAAMNTSSPKYVALHLPKFEIEGLYSLNDALQALGMTEAFAGNADFSLMSSVALSLDRIMQCAKIIVDEEGTEAAAVTFMDWNSGTGEDPDVQVDFMVDHPFYFTIEHQPTKTLLFMGRMCQSKGLAASPDAIAAPTATPRTSTPGLYDLSGRPLPAAPQRGIYIQDGKKRAAH